MVPCKFSSIQLLCRISVVGNVFYMMEYRDIFLLLLKKFDESRQSRYFTQFAGSTAVLKFLFVKSTIVRETCCAAEILEASSRIWWKRRTCTRRCSRATANVTRTLSFRKKSSDPAKRKRSKVSYFTYLCQLYERLVVD